MKFKNLEDKCLYYRGLTDYKLLPNSNVIVMLDGKNFSKMIKNKFEKPFDDDFIEMMNDTAKFLCNNVQGVKFAFVQSDEISLLLTDYDTPDTDIAFGGRLCKIQSILASLATSEFNREFLKHAIKDVHGEGPIMEKICEMKFCQFDCKAWTVPSQNDAYAWFLYRQLDCIRNSKQQFAQTYLPHKDLMGKTTDDQIMLVAQRYDMYWDILMPKYKFGRFIYKEPESATAVTPKGDTVSYVRDKFRVFPAFELKEDSGKEKFYDKAFPRNEG